MYKRAQQGWLKHIDFIILDILCLSAAYALAHLLRYGSVRYLFRNKLYINVWAVLVVFDLLIMLIASTMHNVLKRGYFKELTATIRQDLLVFSAVSIYLFTVKDGDLVSRIVLWLTLLLHIIVSYCIRIIWKKLLKRRCI